MPPLAGKLLLVACRLLPDLEPLCSPLPTAEQAVAFSKQLSDAGQAAMAARLQAQGARVQPPRTAAAADPGIKGIYLDHILLGLQAFSTAIDELADVTTFHQDHFHAMGRAGDLMPKDAPYKGRLLLPPLLPAARLLLVARRLLPLSPAGRLLSAG